MNLSAPFVFLDTALRDKENRASWLFSDFKRIITFVPGDNLELFFTTLDDHLKKGYWICGYFAYEFGYFLDPALVSLRSGINFPLAWLGVCKNPAEINNRSLNLSNNQWALREVKTNITKREYYSDIARIKRYLSQGLTYQVNFTFKIKFGFRGDIFDFYQHLKNSQPTSYSALINTGNSYILSLSPELFFKIKNNKIITRPMKGTSARGRSTTEDKNKKTWLLESKKVKSENLMIVDLLRNDLGKIAKDIRVTKLFTVEQYKTLYQMTSNIQGKLKPVIRLKDIFCSLFPSGSVTGAPKIRTMQLIKSLEKEPRGIYTGAIGYISPKRETCFNVAIRTAVLKNGKGEMGVGGGIIYDSLPREEYREALLKAKFLTQHPLSFYLIESILWEKGRGYFLLPEHLKRLKRSSEYFSIQVNIKELVRDLKRLERSFTHSKVKLRLSVNRQGNINIEDKVLKDIPTPVKIKLCPKRIDPKNIFLYHKTTERNLYERELSKAAKLGAFDIFFRNCLDEITEGAITNIFVLKNDKLYTPALKSGLLPGILRECLLKKKMAEEKTLYLKDLLEADKLYVGNSVRKLLQAQIIR